MPVKSSFPVLSDAVKWMTDSIHCLESLPIKTPSGVAINLDSGLLQPMIINSEEYQFVPAANIANATHFLFEQGPVSMIADAKRDPVALLARGPATINQDALPTHDYAGAEFNQTNFRARLIALGYSLTEEPVKRTTQQT